MKKLFMVMAPFLPLLATSTAGQQQVPSVFFGMTMHAGVVARQPWPPIKFGTLRLWDAGTRWLDINPKPGLYDWTTFDRWLDAARAHNIEVLFTFGGIPTWASGDPSDRECTLWKTPGSCHPPVDLNADGSGSDQTWRDFVTAVATRANGRIKNWEVWNEPHNLFFWHGSMAQIVRMTQDLRTIVRTIDPDAVILSPGTGWQDSNDSGSTNWNALRWTDAYLGAGGKNYIDGVSVHGYVHGRCPSGAYDMNLIAAGVVSVRKILQKHGVQDMSIWNTEGSWGVVDKTCTTDPDMQEAFVGQYYILSWSEGLARAYWYSWNDGNDGKLWDAVHGVLPPGKAYGQVFQWMVGASLVGCNVTHMQNTCAFTRPDGSSYLAVWDRAQTCSNGTCTTTPVKVEARYVDYLDLTGARSTIQDNTVPVGLKPIWLEAPVTRSPSNPRPRDR